MKKCSKCGEVKSIDKFYKRKCSKDGLCSQCKECEDSYTRKYNQDNKEKVAIRAKKYRQTPAGKKSKKISKNKRRAQKANAEYEKFDPIEIFERDGWRCQHCHKKVRPDYKNKNHALYPNLDHIVCLSNGGSHTRLNTQLLCHRCNVVKHNNDSGEQLRLFPI